MNKYSLLLLITAFLILGISLNVQQHRDKQNVKPTHEERVEVVGDEEIEKRSEEHIDIRNISPRSDNMEITTYIKEIWGDNADWGISLAMCESTLNPLAVSPSGRYVGLFQFDELTFDTNCDGNREEWKDQVRCTKKLIDRGEYSRWPNCP